MTRNLIQMVDSSPTKMWYVLVIRVLATFNRMYQTLNNSSKDTRTSSKETSSLTSKTSNKEISNQTSRGQWRFPSFPALLDASIQFLGAPWPAATISRQWYPRWERILSISCGPPNAASRKVVNNMTQVIVGRPYVHVASHLHTTNLFVQLRGSKWWTSSQPIKWWSATRTRQINT